MRPADPILLLILLTAQPGHADGSFNRLPAPAPAEASASGPEAATPASAAEPESPVPPASDPGEEAPQVVPNRGEACIYGPKGLIHRPRGKDCRESMSPPASVDRGQRGRCILGAKGQVLYAPPGVSCEDTLQEAVPARKGSRPRAGRLRD